MIILDLLKVTDWYGVSTEIEFAKGMLEIPTNKKEKKEQLKRLQLWQQRKS